MVEKHFLISLWKCINQKIISLILLSNYNTAYQWPKSIFSRSFIHYHPLFLPNQPDWERHLRMKASKAVPLQIDFARTLSNDIGILTFSKFGISYIRTIQNKVLSKTTYFVNMKVIAKVVNVFSWGKSWSKEEDYHDMYFSFPKYFLLE